MKKVLAVMIASLVFFWAQPSAALVVANAGNGSLTLPMEKQAGNPPANRAKAAAPQTGDAGRAQGPSTYGLLAAGLLAVALRRYHLMQR